MPFSLWKKHVQRSWDRNTCSLGDKERDQCGKSWESEVWDVLQMTLIIKLRILKYELDILTSNGRFVLLSWYPCILVHLRLCVLSSFLCAPPSLSSASQLTTHDIWSSIGRILQAKSSTTLNMALGTCLLLGISFLLYFFLGFLSPSFQINDWAAILFCF